MTESPTKHLIHDFKGDNRRIGVEVDVGIAFFRTGWDTQILGGMVLLLDHCIIQAMREAMATRRHICINPARREHVDQRPGKPGY